MEYCDNYFDTAPSSGEISQGDWHKFFIIQLVHSIVLCKPSVDWGYLVPKATVSQLLIWNLCPIAEQYEPAPNQAEAQRSSHHFPPEHRMYRTGSSQTSAKS